MGVQGGPRRADKVSTLAPNVAIKQAETLLQNYCFETIAACKSPEQQNQFVFQMARDLGQLMALRSAEIVTELLQSVLQHPAKGLVDEINTPLLTQRFWVQAIYTELLHASSRSRAQRGKEEKRPPHGVFFWTKLRSL